MPRSPVELFDASAAPAAVPEPARRRVWRHLPDWRTLAPPDPRLEATIVMPVRNEAAGLRATLAALAAQRELDGGRVDPRRYEVIVLANNCTDASADIVRRFAARRRSFRLHVVEVTFPRTVAHVGHARRVLMDEACRRLEGCVGERGVILSTDGDTRVAPDWLAATLAEIESGVDAVGGRIELDGAQSVAAGMARLARRDEVYQRLRVRLEHALDPDPADPWPRHHQHFGASLALTVAAYRRVGGLPPARFLEDEALYQALRLHDLGIRHSRRVRVVTSSRRDGRVDVGLSWQLREWETLAARGRRSADPLVADPRHHAAELRARRRLRECWEMCRQRDGSGAPPPRRIGSQPSAAAVSRARREGDDEVRAWAGAFGADPDWLIRRVRRSPSFGALWRRVGARFGRRPPPPVPMLEAIALLRRLVAAA